MHYQSVATHALPISHNLRIANGDKSQVTHCESVSEEHSQRTIRPREQRRDSRGTLCPLRRLTGGGGGGVIRAFWLTLTRGEASGARDTRYTRYTRALLLYILGVL